MLELEGPPGCRACGSQVKGDGAGLLKTKRSRGVRSGPAAWRDVGEKQKESTEDVGDRLLLLLLLLALKYPGSTAGSKTTCSYDFSSRQSKSKELSCSWRAETWETSIVAVAVGVEAGEAGGGNEEDQGGCSIYVVGGVRLHLRLPPLASRSCRNKADT